MARKFADLNVVDAPKLTPRFSDAVTKYQMGAVPNLAPTTAKIYRSDIKHISAFFADAQLSQIRPMNIKRFLDGHCDKPTAANRCKRLPATMWNQARGWGCTDLPNLCEGIKGYSSAKRTVDVIDEVFAAVYSRPSAPFALRVTAHDTRLSTAT